MASLVGGEVLLTKSGVRVLVWEFSAQTDDSPKCVSNDEVTMIILITLAIAMIPSGANSNTYRERGKTGSCGAIRRACGRT